jgi:hypothetical protein
MRWKARLWDIVACFVAVNLFVMLLDGLLKTPIYSIVSLHSLIISDASINDLHYLIREETQDYEPKLSGDLILVNTGSLPNDSVRLALSKLIQVLDKYQPKVIGLDLVLDSNFIGLGTSELLNTLVKTPRMVIAKSPQIGTLKPVISPSSAYGIVSFPDNQSTVRRYSSQENTFGVLVAQMLKKDSLAAFDESTFFINYQTMADGIYTVHSPEFDFVSLDSTFRPSSFLMLEGKDILNNDSLTLRALALLGNGRAFLLGHLGNTNLYNVKYDGEDRHRVPPERQLVNREKSMFGILIHANAIENILNPELRYTCWSDSLIYQIIRAMIILIYIYYLLYYKLIKIINIFFSIFLISFPVIYLVLYLMTFQIYIDLGFVLIQIILLEDAVEVYQSLRDFILKKIGYEKTHF